MPSCQISLLLQSGHQLPPAAPASALRAGASTAVKTAVARSGMPQTAKPARQEPSTSASTSGIVSMTPSVSPTRRPLVMTAVPKLTRCGSHCRTSGGSAGCMMAMPALITTVAA